ncbi:alpha/beta fold hydrolase [Paraglaciecola sp.]|uniref:alpha/beta hydrolase family protein n=1 Tax=Paraglaciecola sp. TaxID=1920173 RepID=UPI0030F4AE54
MPSFSLDITNTESIVLTQFESKFMPKGHIIIAPAMGVNQSFYKALANWLSQQGYAVTTFDYRGMGASQHKSLGDYELDILSWATQDCSAVLAKVITQAKEQQQDLPIYWIGHSLGGQIFPLINQIEQVSKVITIASGTGYWKHNAPALRRKAPIFWYLIVPLLTSLFGYFPGKKFGMVGDLPKQVIYQWRRWCLHPEYCVGVESDEVRQQFSQLQVRLTSLCFSDDEMLSLQNMQDLHALFGTNHKQLKFYTPEQAGVKRIGHLGFFREQFNDSLWPQLLLPELAMAALTHLEDETH